MKVFQDPTTGTHIREDGKPGYTCARCGNGYATAATRDDTNIHGCTGLDNDLDSFADSKGLFDQGYTSEDITALAHGLNTVEFVCVWEYLDDLGYGGDSEILGREIRPDATTGEWQRLDDLFWLYLYDATHPVTLDEISSFLDPTSPFENQNLDTWATLTGTGHNVAHEDRR